MKGVKKLILGVAIALIFVFFIAYAIQSIYPGPEYEDFCGEDLPPTPVANQETCETLEGKWSAHEVERPIKGGESTTGWCDLEFTCRGEYETIKESYERNVFFINVLVGIITVVISFFLSVGTVSAGLMGGGAILIIYGTIRYWGSLSDWLRTIMLGIALAVMIWIGYKKLRD
jgi:hypothetical protein